METLIHSVVTAALVLTGILYEAAVFIFGITVADIYLYEKENDMAAFATITITAALMITPIIAVIYYI